jgi:hypothetical protein
VVVVWVDVGEEFNIVRVGENSGLLGRGFVWGVSTGFRVFALVGAMGELDGPLASLLPCIRSTMALRSIERTTEVRSSRGSSVSLTSRFRKRSL